MSLLRSHPTLFFRRVYTEIKGPFLSRQLAVQKRIDGVLFEFDFTFDPSIKLMFEGIYEVDMVNAMRKYLRPGDTFLDVGANIGYLSAIALGLVGQSGQVHSFEPVPQFFEKLKQVASLNPEYTLSANQCALGDAPGEADIKVSNVSNIGWNTMVPGMMSEETVLQSIKVPVATLSSYLAERSIDKVAMMKIDTEGYEYRVLKGLSAHLAATSNRPVLLVEIAPSAYPLLGTDLRALRDLLAGFGYNAVEVHDHRRPVDIISLTETTNVLFLPST